MQIGPFSYRKYQVKFNISFGSDGDEVSFKTQNYYIFDPSTSKGSPTDTLTTVNIPFQGVHQAFGRKWYQELAFDVLVSSVGANMFVKKTVQELCWGYQDPMLEIVSSVNPYVSADFGLQTNYTSQQMADKTTEHTVMMTGKEDLVDVKQYIKWNGKSKLRYWSTAEANAVRGTDGTQFHPDIQNEEELLVFVDNAFRSIIALLACSVNIDLLCCRTTTMFHSGSSHIYGINLFRFTMSPEMLLNSTLNPANAAFYQFGPSGVVNISSVTGTSALYNRK